MSDSNNMGITWDDEQAPLFPPGNTFNNPFYDLSKNKSFDKMSAFKESPFGEHWDKRLNEWAKEDFGNSRIFYTKKVTVADLSQKINQKKVDDYNSILSHDLSDYTFIVYANPDGSEVLKMYNDPNKKPETDYQILVFIETDDGNFDFGKIVRVKFGSKVVDDLKFKFSEFKSLTSSENIANEFIKRAFQAGTSKKIVENVDKERNSDYFKNLLVDVIDYEYDNKKFDHFSWF